MKIRLRLRHKIALIILASIFVGLGLTAFGIYALLETNFAREEIRTELIKILQKQFTREVSIGRIEGNPLFELRIFDFKVSRWDTFESGYVIDADSVYTRQRLGLSDLILLVTSHRITLNTVEMFNPYILIEEDSTGKVTIDYMLSSRNPSPNPTGKSRAIQLAIQEAIIHNATIDFFDVIDPITQVNQVDGNVKLQIYPGIKNAKIDNLRGQVVGLPIQILDASGDLNINDFLVKIRNLKLRTLGSNIRGIITYTRRGGGLNVQLGQGKLAIQEIEPLINGDNLGQLSGTLAFDAGWIGGTTKMPIIEANFTLLDTGNLYGYEVEALKTNYTLRDKISYFENTDGLLEMAHINGKIVIDANVSQGPGYDFAVDIEHLNAQRFFDDHPPEFESDLSGYAELKGKGVPDRRLELFGNIDLGKSRVRKLWAKEAHAEEVSIEVWNKVEYKIHAPRYHAKTLGTDIYGMGTIGTNPDACDLYYYASNLSFDQYMQLYDLKGFSGSISGRGHMRHSILDPAIWAEFSIFNGSIPNKQLNWKQADLIGDISNLFSFMDGNLVGTVYDIEMDSAGVAIDTLTISGGGNFAEVFIPSLTASGVTVENLKNVRHHLKSTFHCQFFEGEWHTHIDHIKTTSINGEKDPLLQIENQTPLNICVSYQNRVDFEPFSITMNKGELFGEGYISKDSEIYGQINASAFELMKLQTIGQMFVNLPYHIHGQMEFSSQISGTIDNPTFSISDFEVNQLILELLTFNVPIPETRSDSLHINRIYGNFDYENQIFLIPYLIIQDPRTLISIDGQIPINLAFSPLENRFFSDRLFDVNFRIDAIDPRIFNMLSHEITIKQGFITGDMSLGGTFDQPSYIGQIQVYDGAFSYNPFQQEITNINADFRLRGNRISLTKLDAVWGGGTVHGGGNASIQKWLPHVLDFNLNATNVSIHLPEYYLKGMVNVNAQLIGTLFEPRIEGQTVVLEGVSYLPFGVEAGQDEYRLTEPAPSPLIIEMDVDLGQRFWLRNGQANMQLTTDPDAGELGARFVDGEMIVWGGIKSVRGDYTFFGKQFLIEYGQFRFMNTAELNPEIEMGGNILIRGQKRENDLTIHFQMTGTILEPKISLYCEERPLSEQDILTLLASNMTWEEFEQTFGSEDFFADEIRITAQGIMESLLANEARKAASLDQFDLETRLFGEDDEEKSVRVTVGKIFRIGTKDVFVSYSRDLLSGEGQRLKVDYILSKWLSLEGETDERGEYNADVKLKYKY